jgi:uncharacterized protein (TIGR02466 family)
MIGEYENPNHAKMKRKLLELLKPEKVSQNTMSGKLWHYGQDFGVTSGVDYIDAVPEFKEWVIDCIKDYTSQGMNIHIDEDNEILPINVWMNVANKGGFQSMHSHANAMCCATYYVNFVPGEHADLVFCNEVLDNRGPFLGFGDHRVREPYHKYPTKEGVLLVWPPHLMHGYSENNADNRISMSMNFLPSIVRSGDYAFKVSALSIS